MARAAQRIGGLRDRVRIERRGVITSTDTPSWDESDDEWEDGDDWTPDEGDGAGNVQSGWMPIGAPLRAEIRELVTGSAETVIADKLTGTSQCLVVLRASGLTRSITTDDRIIDLSNNRILNVRSAPPRDRQDYITLLCETGVADG